MTEHLIQGSIEWKLARCGSLGASQVHEALARVKSGWGASRANLRAQLVAERLTETPSETYESPAMLWGKQTEAQARAAYSFFQGADVTEVGLIRHPTIAWTHTSPDGLVGDDGGLELKAPNTSTHIETLLTRAFPEKYYIQCDWGMACTGRQWWDLCSFDPRLPADLQLFVKRIERDSKRIAQLEAEVREFLAEVDATIAALTGKSMEHLRDRLTESQTILAAG